MICGYTEMVSIVNWIGLWISGTLIFGSRKEVQCIGGFDLSVNCGSAGSLMDFDLWIPSDRGLGAGADLAKEV